MAKKKGSKQKKMDARVDFTPMVDMMMLLITFFMLCTTLSKPQAMQLTMPSNDKDLKQEDQSSAKDSYTITVFLGADNQIGYIAGKIDPENPECKFEKTSWGKEGIRQVFINHETADGINPVFQIMRAKEELDRQKIEQGSAMHDTVYQAKLKDLRNGEMLDGSKIEGLTIIIKPLDSSNYNNLVEILDEMQICTIGKYVIAKVDAVDQQILDREGFK